MFSFYVCVKLNVKNFGHSENGKERTSVHAFAIFIFHGRWCIREKKLRIMLLKTLEKWKSVWVYFSERIFLSFFKQFFCSPSVLVAFPFKHFRYFAWLTWKLKASMHLKSQAHANYYYYFMNGKSSCCVSSSDIPSTFHFLCLIFLPLSYPKWFETWNSI